VHVEGGEPADWAWRRRLRSNPAVHAAYRIVVGVVGAAVTAVGVVLIPAPGPGWLVVFFGLAILASEFAWAERLLRYARRQVGHWTDWATRQHSAVRLLLALGTVALLVAVLWLTLRVSGVPGFVPHSWVPSWTGLRTG
jgi:uncharacterized protein (TIGR02611 family)